MVEKYWISLFHAHNVEQKSFESQPSMANSAMLDKLNLMLGVLIPLQPDQTHKEMILVHPQGIYKC